MRRLACAAALLALAACSPKKDPPATLDRVEVTPPAPTIPAGASVQLHATAVWSDGRAVEVTDQASWSSSAPAVVRVSDAAGTKGFAEGLAAGPATVTATFDGVSGTASATVVALAIVSVEVTPATPSVPKGQELQLTATATYEGGARYDVTASASWTSGAPSFATVSDVAGSKGKVHAVAEGTARITAALDGASGSTDVTVTPATLASVRVEAVHPDLPVGAATALTATAVFSDGTELDVTGAAAWSAAPDGIVDVTQVGGVPRATAVAPGTATVTAHYQFRSGTETVSVHAAVLTSIELTPAAPSTVVGGTVALTATGTYQGGEVIDVTALATWTSAAPLVATVSNAPGTKGLVTGRGTGSASVSASFGGATGTVAVQVTNVVPVAIRIEPDAVTLSPGRSFPLRAYGRDASGAEVELTSLVTWSSNANAVATVSTGGVLSGVATGSAVVMASVSGRGAAANVVVETPYPLALVVTPDEWTATSLGVGAAGILRARALYSDGTKRDVTELAAWGSDAPAVVTVSNAPGSKGVFVAAGAGTARVGASFAGLSADVAFTVGLRRVEWIVVSVPSAPLPVGVTQPLTATAVYDDFTTEDVTARAGWRSSGGAATVDAAGVATTVQAGAAVVTATYGGVSSSTLVSVVGEAPTALEFAPSATALTQGDYTWWSATLVYPNGVRLAIDEGVQLVALDPAVVDVWRLWSLEPVPHGVAPGTAVVEARYAGLVARQTFTVTAVSGLSLSLPSSLAVGATARGSLYDAAGRVYLSDDADWSSSDASVLTVTTAGPTYDRGYVTAVGQGTATITAAYGGFTATRTITVRARAMKLTVTPGVAQIDQYTQFGTPGSQQFTATAQLADGTTLDVTQYADWTSDSSVAGPDYATGQFTARSPGRTLVTAAYGGAGGSAILTVVEGLPTSLRIAAGSPPFRFPKGVTVKFTASARYASGYYREVTSGVTWTSTNPVVAAFSADPAHEGELTTGTTTGSTVINATYAGKSDTIPRTVFVDDPTSFSASPASVTVAIAGSTSVQVRGVFPNPAGAPFTFDLAPWVTWTTKAGATDGVAVARDGYVYGLKPGMTVLTATLGAFSADLPVTVTIPTVSGVSVEGPTAPVYVGTQAPILASALLTNGDTFDVSALATWTSTATAVAEVTGTPPAVAARAVGSTTVTAAWGGKSGTWNVDVTEAASGLLVWAPPVVSVPAGGTGYTSLVPPAGPGANLHVGTEAVVTSSDPSVAEVTNTEYGVIVRGLAAGTSVITGTYRGRTVQALANVYAAPGALSLDGYPWPAQPDELLLHPHARIALYATASGPTTWTSMFGGSTDVGEGATWTTSDAAVVRIVSPGVVEGVAPGAARVTASLGGQTVSDLFFVSSSPLLALAFPAQALAVPLGADAPLDVYALYADGTPLVSHAAAWSSTDTAVVELVPGKIGVLHAKGLGTAYVEATLDGFTARLPVTVFVP